VAIKPQNRAVTNSELWKKFLCLGQYFHFNLITEFLLTYTGTLPKGPWREMNHLCQYCINILKALCFTNMIWVSVLRERHWVLGKEASEGRNSKGFSRPWVCGYENSISGSEGIRNEKSLCFWIKLDFYISNTHIRTGIHLHCGLLKLCVVWKTTCGALCGTISSSFHLFKDVL